MRGFRPIMVLVTLVFPQPRFITHLKFDWDPQSFRHEPRVRAFLVWNQILEDFSVCPHASVSPISSQNPTGAGSHRGRIESAAHHTPALFVLNRSATARSRSSLNCSTHSLACLWCMAALTGT